jgi:hypothetical protein
VNLVEKKVLIFFDEIGLAEMSPLNPLKVLHAYLDEKNINMIGISNYSLDAAK